MARAKKSAKGKKLSLAELPSTAEASAPIDGAAFLAHARPVLASLAKDLLARANESALAHSVLRERWRKDKEAGTTADAFPIYLAGFVDQVAASWLLSCVFARTLEDRGLCDKSRLAGPGAADSLASFRRLAPYLNERDYLYFVFGELAAYPALGQVFDRDHALLWSLGPSAEAARELLGLFTAGGSDAPHYRFGQSDTRLLGDLYQDLNEDVRKRFALLQTPRFVEAFILERTLEPAIERFGLDEVSVFDPTCGSGHFLLGAYARLIDHRRRREPARDARELAELALAQVYGADLNPYAVAVARFRLILAYLEEAKIRRLAEAPALALNLVVADSLLNDVKKRPLTLEQQLGVGSGVLFRERDPLRLDDPELAARVFGKGHAAVVGNPPYITEKDSAKRETIRKMFPSAHRTFSLGVPFTEAFFDYARPGGFVGMITANSFMKREFGKKLIEDVLPRLNLTVVINTQGAYIPGHGTPTVILFGTAEPPVERDVLTVLASRGEPSTPADPEQGEVWRSIAEHGEEIGFENDYITVRTTPRAGLRAHPWSLGGGGAAELKALLEERASKRLGEVVQPPIGRAARTGEDEVFFVPQYVAQRLQLVSKWWMDVVIGEAVRDWSLGPLERGIFPYDREKSLVVASAGDASFLPAIKWLWPYRSALAARSTFQGDMAAAGRQWFEYMQYTKSAHETPLSIAFAFVATHNHFVLDRGGKVFNRSAPIIKLPEDATEDDHLALLAYLNSSTACFWMKQACFPKGGSGMGRGIQDEEWEGRFEFDGTKLGSVPLPALGTDAFTLAAQLDQDGRELAELRGRFTAMEVSAAQWQRESEELRLRQVLLQEELDWCVYADYGLLEPDAAADHDRLKAAAFPGFPRLAPGAQLRPGHRGFEIAMIEDATATSWFARHGHTLDVDDLAVLYGSERVALTRFRMEQARSNSWLSLLETPNFKRRWPSPDYPAESQSVIDAGTMGAIEKRLAESTTVQNAGSLRPADVEQSRAPELLSSESVPFLAAYRYTDAGLTKHALWQETWALQRREDAGEKIGPIDPPPKYDPKDFRKPDYWRLRGKLDVPKERFISYPGCESDEDGEPVYGWAGWDHLQRAKALWQLYSNRKTQEGWPKERLAPLLAGLLELLPWLLQWHDAPNEDGFRMGQEFDALLTAECHDLGLTREDLSAWRPSETAGKRGRKKKSAG